MDTSLETPANVTVPTEEDKYRAVSHLLSSSGHDDPEYAQKCTRLADLLSSCYHTSGYLDIIDDLTSAISLRRRALKHIGSVASTAPSSALMNIKLSQARDLVSYYRELRSSFEINEAIELLEEVKRSETSPVDALSTLAEALIEQASFGPSNISKVDEALSLLREAQVFAGQTDAQVSRIFSLLGMGLLRRFFVTSDIPDLDASIQNFRSAITACGSSSTPTRDLSRYRLDLADSLDIRYSRNHDDIQSLSEAIWIYRTTILALQSTPGDLPKPMYELAGMLSALSIHNPDDESAFEDALEAFKSVALLPQGSIFWRHRAACTWVRFAEERKHTSTLDAYRRLVQLLVDVPLVGTELIQPIFLLSIDVEMVADAVVCAIRSGELHLAIEFLEHVRGTLMWSSSTTTRPRSIKESAGLVGPPKDIPSNLEFALLHGPVVVLNAAEHSCDALVVFPSNTITHVPLPLVSLDGLRKLHKNRGSSLNILKRASKKASAHGASDALGALWDTIVHPILSALGVLTSGDESTTGNTPHTQQRVWWCPTGPFIGLPLHAAQPQKGPGCLDFVISSYTATITSLLEATRAPVSTGPANLFAIAQPDTPGLNPLPCARHEMARLRSILPPEQCTILEGASATVDSVRSYFERNRPQWIHFACHASQSPKMAYTSAFHLYDGSLALNELMRVLRQGAVPEPQLDSEPSRSPATDQGSASGPGDHLEKSRPRAVFREEFACLLACHTAATQSSTSGADEALNIALGLHVAGFRGVLGAMWSIADKDAPEVAGTVYEVVFGRSVEVEKGDEGDRGSKGARPRVEKVAEAVNLATRKLRDGGAEPPRWAPFMHVGV